MRRRQQVLESIESRGKRKKKEGPGHASPSERPEAQPDEPASQGDVRQHGGFADQARADQDHAAEGEGVALDRRPADHAWQDRPPARPARSEEHTSELQSLMRISYAVFCLKKKKHKTYK